MQANREGLFNAYPVDIGVGETKNSKLLQVAIRYRLFEEGQAEGWQDCTAEQLEITGYHILEKKDGSLNLNTIESLKAALGWDGRDPFWMQDNVHLLADHPVQIKLGFEDYNGKVSLKVEFLNPYGSQRGTLSKADDSTRRAVGNRLGGKFRALAGGTPANPPRPAGAPLAPAAGKPAAAPAAPPKPAPAPAPPAACTMDEAWAAFSQAYEKVGPGGSQADCEKQWFAIMAEIFPGKQPEQLTPKDWAVLREQGSGKIIPF